MANRLKMAEHQAIIGLVRLKWSYRRIAAELGIDRQTVSRHVKAAAGCDEFSRVEGQATCASPGPPDPGDPVANAAIAMIGSPTEAKPPPASIPDSIATARPSSPKSIPIAGLCAASNESSATGPEPNAAIVIAATVPEPTEQAGSAGRCSQCEPWRAAIVAGLERGLTAKRIWQDLKAEHGFEGEYQPVQRFVRQLRDSTPPPFVRMESEPGAEAQVDFGKGAPVAGPDGKRRYPHLFRIVLSCSRKAYSEVVIRQTTEQFIRCLENAFVYFSGVPRP
jgi:transposase